MKTESECKFIAPPPSIRKGEMMNNILQQLKQKLDSGQRIRLTILAPAGRNERALADFLNSRFLGKIIDLYYDYKVIRVPMSSREKLIQFARKGLWNTDILAIIRGGGNGIDIFSDPEVVYYFGKMRLENNIPVCIGIGHKQDEVQLEGVVDATVATPTELSLFFKDFALMNWQTFMDNWQGCINPPALIKNNVKFWNTYGSARYTSSDNNNSYNDNTTYNNATYNNTAYVTTSSKCSNKAIGIFKACAICVCVVICILLGINLDSFANLLGMFFTFFIMVVLVVDDGSFIKSVKSSLGNFVNRYQDKNENYSWIHDDWVDKSTIDISGKYFFH